jgi:hypothetical protein
MEDLNEPRAVVEMTVGRGEALGTASAGPGEGGHVQGEVIR